MTTIGVLLAAGEGARFPGPPHKLLARLGTKSIIRWSIEALLGAGLNEAAIVVGAVDLSRELPGELTVIKNAKWRTGQASSLNLAVDYATSKGHDVLVIGLGDQPLVTSSAWRSVAACDVSPLVTASFSGFRRPPVRLARSIWPELPTRGDEGARVVMRRHPELVTEIACVGEPIDIDEPADLERAITFLNNDIDLGLSDSYRDDAPHD